MRLIATRWRRRSGREANTPWVDRSSGSGPTWLSIAVPNRGLTDASGGCRDGPVTPALDVPHQELALSCDAQLFIRALAIGHNACQAYTQVRGNFAGGHAV